MKDLIILVADTQQKKTLHTLLTERRPSFGTRPITFPKELLEEVLYRIRKRRSSALFVKLAQYVSLANCQDTAFLRLRETLQTWFPANQNEEI